MGRTDFRAEIGLCLLLAAVDGEISEREIAALSTRLGRLLGDDVSFGDVAGAVEAELEAISELGVDAYVEKLPSRIPEHRRAEALRAACVVASADELAPEEALMARQVAAVLGVDPDAALRSTRNSGSRPPRPAS